MVTALWFMAICLCCFTLVVDTTWMSGLLMIAGIVCYWVAFFIYCRLKKRIEDLEKESRINYLLIKELKRYIKSKEEEKVKNE